MSVRSFFDSNILAYTDDHDAPAKRTRALDLFEDARLGRWGVVSTQVLQEYFVTATKKLGVPATTARRKVELFSRLDLILLDLPDILGAIDLHRLHRLGFWDALIIRAAKRAGCVEVLSEDLQHGFQVDGVRIVNPFRSS
jgi:predicted nucleic acid-binding protein